MSSSKGHILVVDDSEMNREILSQRLSAAGFEVSTASDGAVALEKIAETSYDLILLDIIMPRMSGLDVLRKLRSEKGLTDLPVVMQTSKSDSSTVVQTLKLGANDYVIKGMAFDVLVARLETHLNIQRRSAVTRSGGFSKLSGASSERKRSSRYYCQQCRSSLSETAASCSYCHTARPASGWGEVASSAFPKLGSIIGERYFLSRFISLGAAATVYQARDLELNREYAAKLVALSELPAGVSPEDIRERTRREVEVISKLSNPHVVKIYDVVEVEPEVFALILDFVHGDSLEKLLEQTGKLDVVKALDITRQVAQGLYEAHQLGIVHCDVKPENIMVEKLPVRGYFAHVLDFGIAEILDFARADGGQYVGTPLYSAPEQIRGHASVDLRTDIYALGATLFHLIKGEPPFGGDTSIEVLKQHLKSPIPRLAPPGREESRLGLVDGLLARMLAKDPDERFSDLSEFIEFVDAIMPLLDSQPERSSDR
jgi:DNA-binding response OmpR family regulator/tRNA A-37 threonylcarbamoyl transferase component Bud32